MFEADQQPEHDAPAHWPGFGPAFDPGRTPDRTGTPRGNLMGTLRTRSRLALPLAAPGLLTGCSAGGAPMFAMFGAYFPAWLLCAVIGVVVAMGARVAFVASGRADLLPWPLLVCSSIGLIAAIVVWRVAFG